MAEYIKRTEELMLAMNAGARAIEHTWRYYGAVYTKDLVADNPQEISYLLAAKALLEASDAPAADVAPVVRCKECKHYEPEEYECGCVFAGGLSYVKADDYCSYGERKDGGGEDESD